MCAVCPGQADRSAFAVALNTVMRACADANFSSSYHAAKSSGGPGARRCTEGEEQAGQEAHRQERLHGVLAAQLNPIADTCSGCMRSMQYGNLAFLIIVLHVPPPSAVVHTVCMRQQQCACFGSKWRGRACAFSQLFCDTKRQEVKAANPEATFIEISKMLGAAWKEASPEDKGKFQEQHAVRPPALGLPD